MSPKTERASLCLGEGTETAPSFVLTKSKAINYGDHGSFKEIHHVPFSQIALFN